MKKCKFCGCEKLIKNGKARGVQRFKCKECGREQIQGDGRKKYENQVKRAAIILYLEGNGFRAIARILTELYNVKISFQMVAYWVSKAGDIIKEKIFQEQGQGYKKTLVVAEMDELFTYLKKNQIQLESGLLLTETHCVCLISR